MFYKMVICFRCKFQAGMYNQWNQYINVYVYHQSLNSKCMQKSHLTVTTNFATTMHCFRQNWCDSNCYNFLGINNFHIRNYTIIQYVHIFMKVYKEYITSLPSPFQTRKYNSVVSQSHSDMEVIMTNVLFV